MHTQQPQHVVRLGVGGDTLGGEAGLVGVDRPQVGHLGDGGFVAGEQGLLRVGQRWRQERREGVDDVIAGLHLEAEGWVGLARVLEGVHWRANMLC